MIPVKMKEADPSFGFPEWWSIAIVDQENDDVWVPAFFLDDYEKEMFEMAELLFYVMSDNSLINGKPFVSINAIIADRPEMPHLKVLREDAMRAVARPR